MRRLLVAQNHTARRIGFALCLSEDQAFDLPLHLGDLRVLPRDDIGQVVDGAGQMRDFFFKMLHGPRDALSEADLQGRAR